MAQTKLALILIVVFAHFFQIEMQNTLKTGLFLNTSLNASQNNCAPALRMINSVAMSPDENLVLANWDFDVARLWDVKTGKAIYTFSENDKKRVRGVAFSPDGNLAVIGTSKKAVVWDLRTFSRVHILSYEMESWNYIYTVAFSPDGKYILTGDRQGGRLWDVQSGKHLFHFFSTMESTQEVKFAPSGMYVLVEGSTFGIWSVETGKLVQLFTGGRGDFSQDGKYLLTDAGGNKVTLWEMDSFKQVAQPVFGEGTGGWTLSPDGKYLFANVGQDTGFLWNIQSQRKEVEYTLETDLLWGFFTHDGNYLLFTWNGNFGAAFTVWDIKRGRELKQLQIGPSLWELVSISVSPNDKYIVTGSADGILSLWSTTDGRLFREFC